MCACIQVRIHVCQTTYSLVHCIFDGKSINADGESAFASPLCVRSCQSLLHFRGNLQEAIAILTLTIPTP